MKSPVKGVAASLQFERVAFWVQIHNMPLICMTKDIGEFLGEQIGEVIELDTRATEYCFRCGSIGHPLRECTEKTDNREPAHRVNHEFGVWLGATSTKKGPVRSSNMGRNYDVHEMHGADVGRSVGVHEPVSLATSKETVEVVVVGSVQCHDAAVHIVDNLSASIHDVGEGSKPASLPVVSPVLYQPEANDSMSTVAESTGSVAPVSSVLTTLPDGQIMSSLSSAVGLGRIEDSLDFGASSVVELFSIGGKGIKGTVAKGRDRRSLPPTRATATVLASTPPQNSSVVRKNRWKRVAWGRGQMDCEDSVLSEFGKRGASELGG
ncbi:hypothetical protein ACOSQ3_032496 [Xanthoceras sorbifolium]